MTLLRQLTFMILFLFLLVFAGTVILNVNITRHYLSLQLESLSQDTATSLGLSISPYVEKNDLATTTAMINAIYDRGYYKNIDLIDMNNHALISKSQPFIVEKVPNWFINAIPIIIPTADADVMSGWKQIAKIRVQSHPGYVYQDLWNESINVFWWFLGCAAISFVLGVIAIRLLLRPLHAIEGQAAAICDREFLIQTKLPHTRELRQVVQAMNTMSQKLKEIFERQARLTEKLREQAYLDPITGLGNRRYFDTHIQHLTQSEKEFYSGALLLIEIDQFKEYNDHHGFQAGDALLQQVASTIKKSHTGIYEFFPTRIAGGTFAILVSGITQQETVELAKILNNYFSLLHSSMKEEISFTAHIGVAYFKQGQHPSDLLAKADMALRSAQMQSENAWHMYDDIELKADNIHGATYWRDYFHEIISTGNIILYFQPVVTGSKSDNQLLHYEVLLRLPDRDGKLLTAGSFMPMAENLGLISDLDRLVINKMIAQLLANPNDKTKYAINLSPNSVGDPAFIKWLIEALSSVREVTHQFLFEIPEYGAVNQLNAVRDLLIELQGFGCELILDHFGRQFSAFGYLKTIKISYLKVDGSYTRHIDQNKDNQFFIHSLIDIAHGLDMLVIAENVETEQEQETLLHLHVDGIQGYLIGQPVAQPKLIL